MFEMFEDGTAFNGNISSWNITSLTNMNYFLENASSFNQDLSGWDTTSVTTYINYDTGASSWLAPNKPSF